MWAFVEHASRSAQASGACSRSMSMMLTTHSLEEAEALCARVAILRQTVLCMGTIPELRQKYCPGLMIRVGPLMQSSKPYLQELSIRIGLTK